MMMTKILTISTFISCVSSAAVNFPSENNKIKFNDKTHADLTKEVTEIRKEGEINFNDDAKIIVLRANNEDIITTLKELNRIFGKKRRVFKKLSKEDIKKARSCRKEKLLYSTKDKSCHQPTTEGPCKNGKWFVAVKGRLDGVCRKPPCNEGDAVYNGSCTPIDGKKPVCPEFQRLYVNKRGVGFCDCQPGFSYSVEKNTCYRELIRGHCEEKGEVWGRIPKENVPKEARGKGHKEFGECQSSGCDGGYVRWNDDKCYKMVASSMCLESETGVLELLENEVTCSMSMSGRSIVGGRGGGCRRGRAWSNRRQRCIRVFRG